MSTNVRRWFACTVSEFVLGIIVSLGFVVLLNVESGETFALLLCIALLLSLLRSAAHVYGMRYMSEYLNNAIETAKRGSEARVRNKFDHVLALPSRYAWSLATAYLIQCPLVLLLGYLTLDLSVDDTRFYVTLFLSGSGFSAALTNRQNVLSTVFEESLDRFSDTVNNRQFFFNWDLIKLKKRTQSYITFCFFSMICFLLLFIVCLMDSQRQTTSQEVLKQTEKIVRLVIAESDGQRNDEIKTKLERHLNAGQTLTVFQRDGLADIRTGPLSEFLRKTTGRGFMRSVTHLFQDHAEIEFYDRALSRSIRGWKIGDKLYVVISNSPSLFNSAWIGWFIFFSAAMLGFLTYSANYFSTRITRPIERLHDSCVSLFTKGNIRNRKLLSITDDSEVGQLTQAFNAVIIRLKSLVNIADAVAEGQLNIPVSGDGDLHLTFRKMISNLSTTVDEITEESVTLVDRGNSFVDTAANQQKLAQDQSKVLNQVSELVENFDQNTNNILASVNEIVASAELSLSSVGELAAKMDRFGVSIDHIRQLLSAIRRISHQSRMLALNIEIESSRVDDESLGLNAIGSEARRLNEEIDSSVKTVRGLIDSMHATLDETSKSLNGNKNFVQMTLKLAREFNEFSSDQSRAGKRLVRRLRKASKSINEAAVKAEEVRIEAGELHQQATRLRESIHRINNTDVRHRNAELTDSNELLLEITASKLRADSDIINQALLRSKEVLSPEHPGYNG